MLTLLTMTGARPEAWELCKLWMRQQDYRGAVRWIVVDDGPDPQSLAGTPQGWQVLGVRPDHVWQPGQNTQRQNILAGLEHVSTADKLVIIEDDDWYHPRYLSTMATRLEQVDMAGEQDALYYHAQRGYGKRCGNTQHASLCQTGLKGAGIEALRDSAQVNRAFIDGIMWRGFTGEKHLWPTTLCIGIKGLPGRGGIGVGHRLSNGNVTAAQVAAIMGRDFEHYRPYGPWRG